MSEKTTTSQFAADISNHKEQQCRHNGEVEGTPIAKTLQHLDALLEIDKGHVEAKDVAGESRDPAKPVAGVCNGKYPVQNQRPSRRDNESMICQYLSLGETLSLHSDPSHKSEVIDTSWFHDVIDCTIKHSDGACRMSC